MTGGRSESASMAGIIDAVDCPDCEGQRDGAVCFPFAIAPGAIDCPRCDGEGLVPA